MSVSDSGSPEGIALAMAWHIEGLEKDQAQAAADRKADPRGYFLQLYGECLAAVKAKRPKGGKASGNRAESNQA